MLSPSISSHPPVGRNRSSSRPGGSTTSCTGTRMPKVSKKGADALSRGVQPTRVACLQPTRLEHQGRQRRHQGHAPKDHQHAAGRLAGGLPFLIEHDGSADPEDASPDQEHLIDPRHPPLPPREQTQHDQAGEHRPKGLPPQEMSPQHQGGQNHRASEAARSRPAPPQRRTPAQIGCPHAHLRARTDAPARARRPRGCR